MRARTDVLDLGSLSLASGEGKRLELAVVIAPIALGGEPYAARPEQVDAVLDVACMTSHGYSLRLRFEAAMTGACMRCLVDAAPNVKIDAREVHQRGSGEELESPYVEGEALDLAAWARDAFALAAPDQVLCRPDCAGLCPICAADLNAAGPEHHHQREPDPRWAKLRELKLE